MNARALKILAFSLGLCAAAGNLVAQVIPDLAGPRTWVMVNGKTVSGYYYGAGTKTLTIKTAGYDFMVGINYLSPNDKAYVAEMQRLSPQAFQEYQRQVLAKPVLLTDKIGIQPVPGASSDDSAASRTWTLKTGRTFIGSFVSAGSAVLIDCAPGNLTINISDLSAGDQAYVSKMRTESDAEMARQRGPDVVAMIPGVNAPASKEKAELRIVSLISNVAFIGLIVAVIVLGFRRKSRVDSEYHKRQDGGATLFEVTPASAPKSGFGLGIGIVCLLLAWAAVAIGLSDMSDEGSFALLLGGAFFCFSLGAVAIFLACLDYRPRAHKFKAAFRVTPDAIETNGRTFNREDIHRFIARNGMSQAVISSSFVMIVPRGYAVGSAAGAGDRARMMAVANSLDLEAGGKAYMLAGGMDVTTANGLLQDVSKIIGFKTD
jgi:hypothetical protein